MSQINCSLCLPGRENMTWPEEKITGLEYLLNSKLLCKQHEEKAKEMIESKPKKYVLKTEPKVFVPTVAKKVERSFYEREREPGEEG